MHKKCTVISYVVMAEFRHFHEAGRAAYVSLLTLDRRLWPTFAPTSRSSYRSRSTTTRRCRPARPAAADRRRWRTCGRACSRHSRPPSRHDACSAIELQARHVAVLLQLNGSRASCCCSSCSSEARAALRAVSRSAAICAAVSTCHTATELSRLDVGVAHRHELPPLRLGVVGKAHVRPGRLQQRSIPTRRSKHVPWSRRVRGERQGRPQTGGAVRSDVAVAAASRSAAARARPGMRSCTPLLHSLHTTTPYICWCLSRAVPYTVASNRATRCCRALACASCTSCSLRASQHDVSLRAVAPQAGQLERLVHAHARGLAGGRRGRHGGSGRVQGRAPPRVCDEHMGQPGDLNCRTDPTSWRRWTAAQPSQQTAAADRASRMRSAVPRAAPVPPRPAGRRVPVGLINGRPRGLSAHACVRLATAATRRTHRLRALLALGRHVDCAVATEDEAELVAPGLRWVLGHAAAMWHFRDASHHVAHAAGRAGGLSSGPAPAAFSSPPLQRFAPACAALAPDALCSGRRGAAAASPARAPRRRQAILGLPDRHVRTAAHVSAHLAHGALQPALFAVPVSIPPLTPAQAGTACRRRAWT